MKPFQIFLHQTMETKKFFSKSIRLSKTFDIFFEINKAHSFFPLLKKPSSFLKKVRICRHPLSIKTCGERKWRPTTRQQINGGLTSEKKSGKRTHPSPGPFLLSVQKEGWKRFFFYLLLFFIFCVL